jgi:hypothetical protein
MSAAPSECPPLLIRFADGTRIRRQADLASDLPILRNGPPGTFVVFPDGLHVSLPTDQIVSAADEAGAASVGFGGMRFAGLEEGRLVFHRVRDLWPAARLSPDRSWTMRLEPRMVSWIHQDGRQVWPAA